MSYFVEAEAKIRKDCDPQKYTDVFSKTILQPTADILINFCRENDDFAKGVVEGDSFSECIKSVVKSLNRRACSDFEVYGRAVKFYMEDWKVEWTINIVPPTSENNVIQLNLMNFLN